MENTKDKTTVSRRKCKHITSSDRQIIEKLYRKGYSVAQIADLLGFHRSSIYRELHRGRVIHLNSQLEQYVTYSADRADDDHFPDFPVIDGKLRFTGNPAARLPLLSIRRPREKMKDLERSALLFAVHTHGVQA